MTSANASDAIVVRDVHKHYGRITALNGMSLTVKQGEIFGLLGANGAGKTTLIRVLTGVTKRDSGEASVLGLNPIADAHKLRPQIGYMPPGAV
jgi:ABC-2 type transport system ATP-binding protein